MSESMPSIPTQSTFTYPNPNPSASPSFTQDDTFMPNPSASPSFTQDDTFMPEPIQPMPTFTQTAFSQPAVQHTHPAQTNLTGQQYPNNVQSQQFQHKVNTQRGWEKMQKEIHCSASCSLEMNNCCTKENKLRTLFGGNDEFKEDEEDYPKQQFANSLGQKRKAYLRVMTGFQKILSQFESKWSYYGVKAAVAPTQSAFIGTTSSAQSHLFLITASIVPSFSQTSGPF
ncbi:hypothetical protein Tco_1410773 [Tanacetum coccineum]